MPNRVYRIFEGSLVTWFFIQALRFVMGSLLATTDRALVAVETRQVSILFVLLLLTVVPTWFAPKPRERLARSLLITGLLLALFRLLLTLPLGEARLYIGLIILSLAGVYFVLLIRASWPSWLLSLTFGLLLDQLARAQTTFDYSLNVYSRLVDVNLSPTEILTIRVSPLTLQLSLSLLFILVACLAYFRKQNEPYEPATLNFVSGCALGGFLALQVMVLASPNVMARWAEVPRSGLVFWSMLMLIISILPTVRRIVHTLLSPFASRLRGLIWLLFLILLLVVGNLLTGAFAAASLLLAQLFTMLLLGWMPQDLQHPKDEQNAPALSIAFLIGYALLVAYQFTFGLDVTLLQQPVDELPFVLVACILAALPRLLANEQPHAEAFLPLPNGFVLPVAAPLVVTGLILAGTIGLQQPEASRDTFRVATYNINSGYDVNDSFSLERTAQTIEASQADIVILQEVDTGTLVTYGADQVEFLAARLDMYALVSPTVGQLRGVAILSRWPIFEPRQAALPGDTTGEASVLRGVVQDQLTGRTVLVIGSQMSPGEEEDRIQQYAGLVGFIVEEPRDLPAVFAVDMGSEPDLIYDQITLGAGYTDPVAELELEDFYTYPANDPSIQRDHIFTFGVQPLAVRTVDTDASDHRLVVVEVGWPR